MKVLVVGGGGREHAIVWKLRQSPKVTELFCAPGNPGTAQLATNVDIGVTNTGALAVWAVQNKIDLTVVGPEAPLAAGLADVFAQHGLRIFGPSQAAAQLEASKSFAKEVMQKAGVPTPRAELFEEFEAAKRYVEEQGAPVVIKADGLAAGKGVTVAMTVDEAIAALKECLLDERFGSSGKKVVVEEFIKGREASVMAIIDGTTVLPLVVSQDYKRLNDGDQGPNTGGMGAISPTDVLADEQVEGLAAEIFIPVLKELWSRDIRYVGFLYAGVIVDEEGVARVLEFNCRLGDPETQVLLPRLQSDLCEVLDAAVSGKLSSIELSWKSEAAACVVLSSRGYPGEVDDGKPITGLESTENDVFVFHAGTTLAEDGQTVVSKGGRVLTVAALGETRNRALGKAYARLEKISFDGMHCRRDIGGGAW
ncbi:MAG: phosphoribosylamine--glycine ligase [Bdellovibrionales bacterium]|nr:phosphoribosylamine--glycine ligase [Bdellovibrionales bacterium]